MEAIEGEERGGGVSEERVAKIGRGERSRRVSLKSIEIPKASPSLRGS